MSMLRKCHSLKLKLFSLIIVNKEYYNLLNFEEPEVKYLWIDSYCYPFYPVNTFHENKWAFDWNINNENVMSDSLSAYAVFKFLVNSNFIYSLEEIKVPYSTLSNPSMNLEESWTLKIWSNKNYAFELTINYIYFFLFSTLSAMQK